MKRNLDLEETKKGLHEFQILTAESTFLVKTFFFLFFGFSINLTAFNSTDPFLYGLLIFAIMWGIRYAYFTATSFRLKPSPLVFISPRGLISILLFLQIKEVTFMEEVTAVIDERVLLVVILASMLIMTQGTMKKPVEKVFVDSPNTDEIPLEIENISADLDEESSNEEQHH
jgi:NhaP-type Na+/H+ or K+/H+ antiporter